MTQSISNTNRPNVYVAEIDVQSLYRQGTRYKEAENFQEAFRCFNQAAEKGHAESQNELGEFYMRGLFVDKDESLARKWLEEASANGCKEADTTLVILNAPKGSTVTLDIDENGNVVAKLEKPAEKESGKPVSEYEQQFLDDKTFTTLLTLVETTYDPESMYELALCFLNGTGVEVNEGMAKGWLKESSKLGNKKAETLLKSLKAKKGDNTVLGQGRDAGTITITQAPNKSSSCCCQLF